MTNSYWEKRQKQWIRNQDKEDENFSRKLEGYYKQTANELEKEIATYFSRYGEDNVIQFRTLLQDLSKKDRDLLYQNMEKFAEKYPKYEHLLPVRESIYKLNRLEGLHYSTQLKLLELGVIEQKEFEKHLMQTYKKNYDVLIEELGLGKQFLSVNDTIIQKALNTKWVNNGNFSNRIWQNKEKLLNHLTTTYRDGLARGDNYDKMSQAIMDRFGVGFNDAKRLVWTESSFVLNQAHIQPYIELGYTEYELNAILDSRTSDICKEMHEKTFRFNEMRVGVNFPPFHPWCRTTFIAAGLDENELELPPDERYNNTKDAFKAVRYTNIDKEFAKEIDNQFLDLINTYPIGDSAKRLTVRALKNTGNASAYHRYGFNVRHNETKLVYEVVLSNRVFKDKETATRLRELIAKERKGKNVNRHHLATIDHEYAHVIDTAYTIEKLKLSQAIDKWDGRKFKSYDEVQEFRALAKDLKSNKLSEELKESMKKEYDIKSDREFFDFVNDELGSYAATSREEFLAEGFSAYRHIPKEKQTEFLKKFGKHFNRLFKGVF